MKRLLLTILRLTILALPASALWHFPTIAEAQTASPFLISPYYSTTSVSQWYSADHPAHDFLLRYTQVLAADAGTITRIGWYSDDPRCHQTSDSALIGLCGFGLHMRIRHSNNYLTIYGHMSATAFNLSGAGTSVNQGQIIGTSGHTGYSTGPHLHFEVRNPSSDSVNPFNPNLWKDGQWITPSRSIPAPVNGGEIIVHEATGGFTKGYGGLFNNPCSGVCGGWLYNDYGSNPYTDYYAPTYGNFIPDKWAKWQPQLPSFVSIYEVFVHIPTSTISRTWQARYSLVDISGNTIATGVVDQAGLPNLAYPHSEWVSIGSYSLFNGSYIYTSDATEEPVSGHCLVYCNILVDAVKFVRRGTTYLPDLRYDGGWTSQMAIRNDGGGPAKVSLMYFDGAGNLLGTILNLQLPSDGTWTVSTYAGTSAVVEADQDVNIVATRKQYSPVVNGAYTGVATNELSGSFYVPVVLRQVTSASGIATSDIVIQNAGTASVNVQLQLKASPGSGFSDYSRTINNLAPNGSYRFRLKDDLGIPTGWVGSAVVTGGTLAVTSDLYSWSEATDMNFNAFPANSPGTNWFVPMFLSRLWTATGYASTPVSVQNLSGATIPANGVELNCTPDPSSGQSPFSKYNPSALSPNASYSFNPVTDQNIPGGWVGSCRVITSYNVVSLVQIRYPADQNASAYEGVRSGGTDRSVFYPIIQKRLADGSATSLHVQNLSTGGAATVTFYYKASSSCPGFSDVTVGPYSIPAGGSINHNHRLQGYGSGTSYHGLPDGWCGSLMVVSSDQPIDGFGQITNINNTTGDTIMAYNALTRP